MSGCLVVREKDLAAQLTALEVPPIEQGNI